MPVGRPRGDLLFDCALRPREQRYPILLCYTYAKKRSNEYLEIETIRPQYQMSSDLISESVLGVK